MEYYSAIKRNKIELFVVRWMDLESIILSKSEREKQIPYANTYIWNQKKKGSEKPRGRTGIKTQDGENGLEDTGRGKGKLGRSERAAWTYIHYQM